MPSDFNHIQQGVQQHYHEYSHDNDNEDDNGNDNDMMDDKGKTEKPLTVQSAIKSLD